MRQETNHSRTGTWDPAYLLEGSLIVLDATVFSHPRSEKLQKQLDDALERGDAVRQPDDAFAEVKRKMLCSSLRAALELAIGRAASRSSERLYDEAGELLRNTQREKAIGKTFKTRNGRVRIRLAADDQTEPGRGSTSWPTTPDAAHNAWVESEAIAHVRKNVAGEFTDRQKDKCGWDLEFKQPGQTLCIEVKGLSGDEIRVELTPNEYIAMNRAMTGNFSEGKYRLAVVTNALIAPRLFLFEYDSWNDWICELTGRKISLEQVVAARLTE